MSNNVSERLYVKNALYISGDIGESEFIKYFQLIKNILNKGEELKVFLSVKSISPIHASVLYNLIKKGSCEKKVFAIGKIEGFALFIFLAFDKRYIFDSTKLHMNEFYMSNMFASLSDLKTRKSFYDKIKGNLIKILKENQLKFLIKNNLSKEIEWDSQKILENNVCNEKIMGVLNNV